MKQRITYLLPEGSDADPANINVGKNKLTFRNAKNAALERRLTIGLNELPEELSSALESIHELHIRWASPRRYSTSSPLVSRLPPGLHAFYTPRESDKEADVCPLLKDLFDKQLKCNAVSEAFSRPDILSERFASSSTYQFFHSLPKLLQFQASLSRKLCNMDSACVSQVATLGSANYVDIDFDAISHVVILTAFWAAGTQGSSSQSTIEKLREQNTVEVGVLQPEKAEEPEELKLGGRLTVLGDDEKPSGTLFAFPSRHHPLPTGSDANYAVSFQLPSGLHPKLKITFPAKDMIPPRESCALHAYFTLPSALFIDRYQLSDPLFLASQNLVSLRSLSGEEDLEAPDWVVNRWGSAALLELVHAETSGAQPGKDWTMTIPTHLRYLPSSTSSTSNASLAAQSQAALDIPWPSVFWACEAEGGLKMTNNPFDRVNLGYDGLFGPKTMFYHIPPRVADGQNLMEQINVPVLDADTAVLAENATLAVLTLGFGWICWKLLGGSARGGERKVSKSKGN